MTPEGCIKSEIMDWLRAQPRCYVRLIQVRGVPGRTSPCKGIADIIGTWQGHALAIEVKVKGGKLNEDQIEFLWAWVNRGEGLAIIAYSLSDVVTALSEANREKLKTKLSDHLIAQVYRAKDFE